MKRYIGLLALTGVLLSPTYGNTLDYDNDPGNGYSLFYSGIPYLIVLDDVNRTTALEIKQVNIAFINLHISSVDVTMFVYEADSSGLVGNLLYTASLTSVPIGIYQLQFPGSPTTIGKQSLWIGISVSSISAGMLFSPNPNPTIGSSTDKFAVDNNLNGTIEADEYFSYNGNPVANFAIETVVPEPASMIILGAGVVGLMRLHRHKG